MFILKKLTKNKILRKIFFKLLFLFIFFKIKRNKLKNIDHILVLGKGYSLNSLPTQVNKIKEPSLIILANFEKNDLDDYRLLNSIKRFPIIILGNITEPILNLERLKELNIIDFYIQRIKYDSKRKYLLDRPSSPFLSEIYGARKSFKFDAYTSKTKFLPNDVHFFLERLRKKKINFSFNCGLASIILACSLKPKKITMFGFDFYKTNYFNKHLLECMEPDEFNYLRNNSKNFSYVFKEITKFYSKIQFTIFSRFKIPLKRENLIQKNSLKAELNFSKQR